MQYDKSFSARALELFAKADLPKGLQVQAAKNGPAEILMYDHIGYGGVTDKDMAAALAEAGDGPINLRVNSPGGDVFAGVAIRNMLRERGGVSAIVDGVAASAAAYILTGADRVEMHDTALVMIHRSHTVAIGNAGDMREVAGVMEKIDAIQAQMFAEKTGKTVEDVVPLLDAETWFSAEEALVFGLADSVITTPKTSKKKAKAATPIRAEAEAEPAITPVAAPAEEVAPVIDLEVERRRRLVRLLDAVT